MQACVAAVLCTNAARHGASTWNSPVWPLLPLLLNRLTELLALGFGHIYLTVRGTCRWLPCWARSCPRRTILSAPAAQANSPCRKLRQAWKLRMSLSALLLPCLPDWFKILRRRPGS